MARKLLMIAAVIAGLIAVVSLYEIKSNHEVIRFVEGRMAAKLNKGTFLGTRINNIKIEKNAYGCRFYKVDGEADFMYGARPRKRPFRCIVIEGGPGHRFIDLTYTENGEKILD